MKGRKGRFLFTLFLTLLVFGFGTRIVRADETDNFQSDKKSIETAETKILEEEFDFKEILENTWGETTESRGIKLKKVYRNCFQKRKFPLKKLYFLFCQESRGKC